MVDGGILVFLEDQFLYLKPLWYPFNRAPMRKCRYETNPSPRTVNISQSNALKKGNRTNIKNDQQCLNLSKSFRRFSDDFCDVWDTEDLLVQNEAESADLSERRAC